MSGLSRESPLVLFDGDCNLCRGAVQFVLRREARARFRFAALQSAAARGALAAAGIAGTLPDSLVLLHRGRVLVKSAATLAIASRLRFPWPLLTAFWLVPAPLRDLVYDWIARRRHRWFGQRPGCEAPGPAVRERFLDAGERPAAAPDAAAPGGQAPDPQGK